MLHPAPQLTPRLVAAPKISVGGAPVGPVCSLDQLERLLALQLGRLPASP